MLLLTHNFPRDGCAFFRRMFYVKGLKLSEILVTVLISVVFAIIYNLWWFVYNIVQVAGIHLEQLTYGVVYGSSRLLLNHS